VAILKQLNKSLTMNDMSPDVVHDCLPNLPEKAIQFGGGNFLRGFVDWLIHELNKQQLFNGKVAIVQSHVAGSEVIDMLKEQDYLYTVVLRGRQNGKIIDKKEIVSSISRTIHAIDEWSVLMKAAESPDLEVIFSNTTEAGITYSDEGYPVAGNVPESFPGKLTMVLHHRYETFANKTDCGLAIIPCELIEQNGDKLKELVLRKAEDWELSNAFKDWVEHNNSFCNTLVDRIVTGYPKDAVKEYEQVLGYKDNLITVGEPYHMFAVDAPDHVKEILPFHRAGLNIKWGDVVPHRELKVRLLNAPHTMMFATGYLYGADTVLDVMEEEKLAEYVQRSFNELLPTVNMTESVKKDFVEDIKERFLNPFNKHYLTDIGMNALFKYHSRILPSLLSFYDRYGHLPQTMVFSLAAIIAFYRPDHQKEGRWFGKRGDEMYSILENRNVLDMLTSLWQQIESDSLSLEELVEAVLKSEQIWGRDLTAVPNLHEEVTYQLRSIREKGMKETLTNLLNKETPI
jgi:tagaturonate reductase